MTGRQPDVSWFRAFGCSSVVYQGKELVEHHKLAPRGESGVFVGLGLMMGRKAWLIYSSRLNTIYASTNCTFDETLFPARATDQRVFGYYDAGSIDTFRADMHDKQLNSTLQSDFPQFEATVPADSTPEWVPDHIEDSNGTLSQAPTVPNSPISASDLQFPGSSVHRQLDPDEISPLGGGSNNDSTPRWGSQFVVDPRSSSPPGGDSASDHVDDSLPPSNAPSEGSSAGRATCFPNKRYKKGKRLRFGDKPPPVGTIPKHWTDCKDEFIADVDDEALAEYLI
eukprot:636225-Rhodomonas_salina.1